jgi:3-oxoadipate enol-lactonase/3-oxoadipate enol-lactonase/4-carboxymuconolactone decarboxylase
MPTITVHGHALRYRVHGAPTPRPPVVLIHGAAGGQYVWLEQRHLPGCQVITLDLPGHGRSAPPLPAVTIDAYADLVAAFAQTLGHERFVAVGHSMGGAVALTLALDRPDRVAALGLLATGARLPVSDLVFAAMDTSFDQLGELFAQTAYAPGTDRALVARFTAGPLQVTPEIARADFEACAAFDVRARLQEVTAPTLILAGAEDQLMSAGRARQLAAGIAGSRLELVADAGHMVMQEQPARVNAALTEFLAGPHRTA